MSKLVVAIEYGCGLGNVCAFMPVADVLREAGWTINFALPCAAPEFEFVKQILEHAGYASLEAPGTRARVATSHAELIDAGPSFANAKMFEHDLTFWLRQWEKQRPDIVIGAHAVTPLIAARLLGIRCATLDSGFFYWRGDGVYPNFAGSCGGWDRERNLTVNAPLRQQYAETHVLNVVNASLRRRGASCLEKFSDIFAVDCTIRLNAPALALAGRSDAHAFIGIPQPTAYGARPRWPATDAAGPRIFVYLKFRLANGRSILKTLTEYPLASVIVCIPDVPEEALKAYARPHIVFCRQVLDMSVVLEETDVVVCNGGTTMVAQTLAAGKSMLLAPAELEQQLNSATAARMGAAVALAFDSDEAVVRAKLDQLLQGTFARGRSYTACARMFMRGNRTATALSIAADLVDLVKPSGRSRSVDHATVSIRDESANFAEYDVVFLSFDEPNADAHWEELRRRVGNAVRIHGIKGFDTAHKVAASAVKTERFVLVCADNRMDHTFFSLQASVPALFRDATWQWCSVNSVTGLAYPFGGVNVWTRTQVNAMRSHEACEDPSDPLATDFWAQPDYRSFQRVFSVNLTNGSPYQAFRAAFREGAKLTGWWGLVKKPDDFVRISGMPQSKRLSIWMSVGADVDNGFWSLLGARLGFLSCFDPEFDPISINDYEWFDDYWAEIFGQISDPSMRAQGMNGKEAGVCGNAALREAVLQAGHKIHGIAGDQFALDLSADQSRRIKQAMRSRMQHVPPLFKPFGLMDGFH